MEEDRNGRVIGLRMIRFVDPAQLISGSKMRRLIKREVYCMAWRSSDWVVFAVWYRGDEQGREGMRILVDNMTFYRLSLVPHIVVDDILGWLDSIHEQYRPFMIPM